MSFCENKKVFPKYSTKEDVWGFLWDEGRAASNLLLLAAVPFFAILGFGSSSERGTFFKTSTLENLSMSG